jgi:hypothetical protein
MINIAGRIRKKFDIPNCICIIDGTLLFPLEIRPMINGDARLLHHTTSTVL